MILITYQKHNEPMKTVITNNLNKWVMDHLDCPIINTTVLDVDDESYIELVENIETKFYG